MLPALAILSMGMHGIGSIFSAFGQNKQAQDAADAYEYNAQMSLINSEIEAGLIEQNSAIEQESIRREFGRVKGKQQAAASSTGLVSTSGSFLNVMADQAYEAERQEKLTEWQGKQSAELTRWRGRQEAALAWQQAHNTRKGGKMSAISTLLGGASSMLMTGLMFNKRAQ